MEQPSSTTAARSPATFAAILDWCAGVVSAPVPTLRLIAAQRPVLPAILVLEVVGIIVGAASGATASVTDASPGGLTTAGMVAGAVLGGLLTVPSAALGALLVHVVARMFGGQGPYSAFFSTSGFASVVWVFTAPLTLLGTLGGPVGEAVSGVGELALFIWAIVLNVLAIRESYATTTGTAIGILLVSILVVIALVIVLVLIIVLLVVLGLAVLLGG
jgi:hypothetical protein